MNPVILGSATALCWGTLDFFAGGVSRLIGAGRTTAGVTFAGAILLTLWLLILGEIPPLSSRDIWLPAIAGAGFALATLWLFAALASGPMALAVPITMAYPATILIIASLAGRQPTLLQIVCVALILAGVVAVALGEATATSANRRRTIIFALLAHATFVIAVIAGQAAAPIFGELESVWLSRLAGCLVTLPFLFIGKAAVITAKPAALIVLMGLLDVVALSLLFAAGSTAQPEIATVCASASGAVTVILARVILREPVAPVRWLGIGLTFAGLASLSALKG